MGPHEGKQVINGMHLYWQPFPSKQNTSSWCILNLICNPAQRQLVQLDGQDTIRRFCSILKAPQVLDEGVNALVDAHYCRRMYLDGFHRKASLVWWPDKKVHASNLCKYAYLFPSTLVTVTCCRHMECTKAATGS